MQLSTTQKLYALTAPATVGLLILGYFYCCPALAQIPNAWNVILARYFLVACVLGGAVTSIFALILLKSQWDKLDQILKTMAMVINLGWLGTIGYIAIHFYNLASRS